MGNSPEDEAGDYLLCYLTRASRWVGILEVTGEGFYDQEPIWASHVFPSRVRVKPIIALDPEYGVPVLDLRDELSVFQGLTNPNRWSGPFRGSPAKWKASDGEAIVKALQDAEAQPVHRPLKNIKKSEPATAVVTDDGAVTIPEDDDEALDVAPKDAAPQDTGSVHTEMQYLLLRLGSDMGFDVYVARNDQSKEWKGHRLSDVPRRRDALPKQFDLATNKIVELIDVLWLDGNAIVAAFEVESTTSIYSGLLRMSDLLSMQPNISVPLFIVASDEWRGKVTAQVNRATFARMKPPLVDVCRYISFEGLRDELQEASKYIKFMKSDFLHTISEDCHLEEG